MLDLIGGARALRRRGPVRLGLHAATEAGLKTLALESLLKNLDATRDELLAAVAVSARTWARRQQEGALSSEESDRLLRVARVAAHAEEILGGRSEAVKWLKAPNRALGGRKPLELVHTDAGAELVTGVLGRLEHSVFG